MKIILSGSPGTGKTEVSKLLGKKLQIPVYHINDFVKKNKLAEQNGEVDLENLYAKIEDIAGLLESHLLCELPLSNRIVILRCAPEKLEERLKERRYTSEKLKKNLEAEAIDYCSQVAGENYSKIIEVDTTNLSLNQVADKIVGYLKTGKSDNPDFSEFILKNF